VSSLILRDALTYLALNAVFVGYYTVPLDSGLPPLLLQEFTTGQAVHLANILLSSKQHLIRPAIGVPTKSNNRE
jgi:hypothetical protein